MPFCRRATVQPVRMVRPVLEFVQCRLVVAGCARELLWSGPSTSVASAGRWRVQSAGKGLHAWAKLYTGTGTRCRSSRYTRVGPESSRSGSAPSSCSDTSVMASITSDCSLVA